MSFSAEVKSELLNIIPTGRHCQLAEIAAMIYFSGTVSLNKESRPKIFITAENEAIRRKYFTLLEKAFNIEAGDRIILQALRLYRKEEQLQAICEGISSLLIKNTCCRRAYLRSTFICIGSMSNPQGGYHLEFVFNFEQQAKQLKDILNGFSVDSKITKRKKYFVVYVKEGASIVDLLNIMGAHNALLRLETLRVEKEVRNSVNRKVNCEAANISKAVTAAARQIEEIIFIKDKVGFANLPANLKQIAELRLEYPDIAMQELGALLNPPIGKSGVNHRLRKLSEIAKANFLK
ncbi:MAG: DNA-binding protein WhiA [Lachnospiraceae bacterium]|nr:DNA-binding protein WhiA [Lachnospiraceae bacterium]